jgi:hypothetical protein
MLKHNQDPADQLSRKHELRAKAATWMLGIGLLGAAAGEVVSAQPATAAERTARHESQTPRALISGVDKKLISLKSKMRSAHGLVTINGTDPRLNSTPDLHLYYLSAPDPKMPHHYNLLQLVYKDGQKIPLYAGIGIDAKSNVLGDAKNTPKGMILSHSASGQKDFTPGLVELWAQRDSDTMERYCASTTNFDGNHPSFGATDLSNPVDFKPVSPEVVSKEVSIFFNQANKVAEANT